MLIITLLLGASALNLRHSRSNALMTHQEGYTRVGGCGKVRYPGAGMDASEGLVTIYKDGYFHIRCMMDAMESEADWHNERTRPHEYVVKTNVTIVRYTDRVDKEKQVKMKPRICFDFCRTVPDMLYFGLTNGRDCYCTPYYHQVPGDGACSAQCEGDISKTCGNTKGMSDVYEMHTCGDVVDDADADVDDANTLIAHSEEISQNASFTLHGMDSLYDILDQGDLRHAIMNLSRPLNAMIMDLDRKIGECTELSDTLRTTLQGVDSTTTVASEVLKIETEQRALNKCAVELKAAWKKVYKTTHGYEMGAAYDSVGLSHEELKKLGESLLRKYVINPMNESTKAWHDEKAGCSMDEQDSPDCRGSLSYWMWGNWQTGPQFYLDSHWYQKEGEVVYEDFAEEGRLFCMDLCAENEKCAIGSVSIYTAYWDSWGYYNSVYCSISEMKPLSEMDANDMSEWKSCVGLGQIEDDYRYSSTTFMKAEYHKKVIAEQKITYLYDCSDGWDSPDCWR